MRAPLAYHAHLFDNCSTALNVLKSKSDLFHFTASFLSIFGTSYYQYDTLGEAHIHCRETGIE